MPDLKPALLTQAALLGFDACRIAPCLPPPHAAEFDRWLSEGRAGEMTWLERNKARRLDPHQVLPGARSVIILAMNYWQGPEAAPPAPVPSQTQPPPTRGRIARYAWGGDYHDLIETKLHALDTWLTAQGGQQKPYVDTGPILERDFAALAGLGWHGKSTMLISHQLGTWFFLAAILTTLDLPADPPAPDRCGTCERCITACPTAAITAPRQLDARRCISYLTIELKTSIPEEFRTQIGDRIYGCDDCLTACPWNRFAQQSRESTFAARAAVHLSLVEMLALTEDQFRTLFKGSPIKRIKRRGLLRNVCVALGNTGTLQDLPALQRAASDPEALIREHALWAITQIKSRSNTPKVVVC